MLIAFYSLEPLLVPPTIISIYPCNPNTPTLDIYHSHISVGSWSIINMGVGDYVHAKEAPQLRPPTRDGPNQSRQFLAEQAKVDIPATKLVAPMPQAMNGQFLPEHQWGSRPQSPFAEHQQGDMFDTDVEGVDDSTVAGTTVMDVEERPQFQLPPSLPPSRNAQRNDINNRPLNHFRQGHRLYGSNWYENLGDKAMKSAGFDSDDADDDGSQFTSSLAEDYGKASETNDWYYSHKHRPNEEPLSRRLEGFWNASKRTNHKTSNPTIPEPNPPALAADAKKVGQIPPVGGGRKVTLMRSHTATPRTRFSPPKPSLLEQLDVSPTRRTSAARAKHTEKTNTSAAAPTQYDMDDADLFASDNERRNSGHSVTAFDITNLDLLDDDETIQDPFSKHTPTKKPSSHPAIPKKREFEADYPPEILYQKSFSDLQSEPFDYTPAPTTTKVPATEREEPLPDTDDKVSFLLRLSEQDRASYLSNLSIDEWEDYGDQLVDQFSQMLSKMKDLRRARRKTMAVFEGEIKRRHELVEGQTLEMSRKLEDMRTGGAEVLRGSGRRC